MVYAFSPRPTSLKIALVSDWYLPRVGGVEMHMADLARELGARGHNVHVITTTAGVSSVNGICVHRHTVPMLRGLDVAFPNATVLNPLARIFRNENFDVVHAHGMLSSWAVGAILLAARLGVASVKTNHSMLHRHPLYGPLSWLIVKLWSKRADVMTAVSLAAAEDTRKVCRHRFVPILSNGINSADWRCETPRPAELRIISVMRLASRKSPIDLIRAVPRVLRAISQRVEFVIVGDGPERCRMEREVMRLGVGDCVRMVGERSRAEIKEWLAGSHIFALPSRNEGFGIAALEARCAGLPVVAMNSGGVADVVEHGVTGLLANTNEEFADYLAQLVNETGQREWLASQTLNGLDRFSWDQVIARHLDVYQLAIERRRRKLKSR
jgi:glycosyltransferase involved in cell wall biosynthesis